MTREVDSYRYVSRLTGRIIRNWVKDGPPANFPWTPLEKPLSACTVALISSGGVSLTTDQPFDQEGERQNPWWGDPSYRRIPHDTTEKDIIISHLHINPQYAYKDLNCMFPLQRLQELELLGEIGQSAPTHYSIMGYILRPDTLIHETTPKLIADLHAEEVDAVVLVPV